MALPRFQPYLSTYVGIPYLGVPEGLIRCEDVSGFPLDAEVVELDKPLEGIELIPRYKKITRIACSHFEDDWIPHLAELPKLRHLDLSFVKRETLPSLAPLTNLRIIVMYSMTRLQSFEFLRGMTRLQSLCLSEVMKATDLGPLSTLTDLRELEIDGTLHAVKRVESLEPLSALTRLQYLSLALKVNPANKSLAPLYPLKNLTKLIIGDRFKGEEYDQLLKQLPKLKVINQGLASQWPPAEDDEE